MGKYKSSVNREDKFDRDSRRMRNGIWTFAISIILWGIGMLIVNSLDGRLMIAVRPVVMWIVMVPALSLCYVGWMAGVIKYERDNS